MKPLDSDKKVEKVASAPAAAAQEPPEILNHTYEWQTSVKARSNALKGLCCFCLPD